MTSGGWGVGGGDGVGGVGSGASTGDDHHNARVGEGGVGTVRSGGNITEYREFVPTGVPNSPQVTGALLLLAQQLPPLPKFTGETKGEGETILEWLEQFELIAAACQWSDSTRLVNLVTRLKGQAFAFYRSCDQQKRSRYSTLVEELKRRFMPVHVQAVQSSLFHDRKQRNGESVDCYAQELRFLFHKAYPAAQQATLEMQEMARSVLTNQFVSGLQPQLRSKLVGREGHFEQLLTIAKFEEAKIRELHPPGKLRNPTGLTHTPAKGGEKLTNSTTANSPAPAIRCYSCGNMGHRARDCPDRERRQNRETPAANKGSETKKKSVSAVVTHDTRTGTVEPEEKQVEELKQQLRDAEVALAPKKKSVIMRGVTCEESHTETMQLGPTVYSDLEFEGCKVKALIDTGSPATIVSLDYLLDALAKGRPRSQTPEEWIAAVRSRLQPAEVNLRSYGGGGLDIVGQIRVNLSSGPHRRTTVVLVQKGAPEELLLRTDLQPSLGFRLYQGCGKGEPKELLLAVEVEGTDTSTEEKKEDDPVEETVQAENRASTVVRLLKAERLPAHHGHLIRASVEPHPDKSRVIFVPREGQGWEAEEGLVEVTDDHTTTLILKNPTNITLHLEKGDTVGELQPVEEVSHRERGLGGVVGKVTVGRGDTAVRREELWRELQIEEHSLSSIELAQLRQLVEDFEDIFALDNFELGRTTNCQHAIDTGDHSPIHQLPRRVPFALRGKIDDMVTEMLDKGVIKPSQSPWAGPVVLVSKKDGNLRFCVDYRKLNAVTKMDVFPLPRIDDSLDLLAHTQYFTALDLASGYWQVPLDPDSKEKTAFCTPSGLYEFQVMPFGLCNAPATFQRLMESVLAGLTRSSCMVYLDDILVIGKSFTEHLNNLRLVFTRLREAGLRLKPKKCCLAKREVEYLGYIVTKDGIAPDPEKVAAVQEFPEPQDLKALRSFVGLASYYRRFIPSFSKIAAPLFTLTKKDTLFQWSAECQAAFTLLKKALTEAPVLAYPRFDVGFLLETNASRVGLGAVLAQKQEDETIRPVAYASRTLQAHERNYGVTEGARSPWSSVGSETLPTLHLRPAL